MRQTIVERLFSGRNLDNGPVHAGDFVDARIDGAMCHYQYMDIHHMAVEAGFADGFPRVWDENKVYALVDHHQLALSQTYAEENVQIRKEVS